jgi:tripartite ATP-independent transporter DctM subunit
METLFLILLVLTMAFALASGYPVAFALPGSAIFTVGLAALCGYLFEADAAAYFVQGGAKQWLNAGVTNFRGIYWEVERDTLIAIPLFVFMGIMLERSKVAEDLLVTMAQLFGPVPGGLGIAVVFVGALLAATTGIVGATVIAMGLISLPVMMRAKYSNSLATGTIAASGTLGQIIPPSIVLIILADQLSNATDQASTLRQTEYKNATGQFSLPSEFDLTSTSAGDMFLGALLPGLVLVGLYMLYILILAIIKPKSAPPVPFEGSFNLAFIQRVILVLFPPLGLIFAVLGSIIMGIATVNQAGAIGAIGAMIMAGYRLKAGQRRAYLPAILALASVAAMITLVSIYDINIKNIKNSTDVAAVTMAAVAVAIFLVAVFWSAWRTYRIDETLQGVMIETAKTTSLVFIILLGAAMLTAAFRAFGGEELVRDFLTGLPGGFIMKFVVVMAVIFILGFFLDFIEIAVVVVPIIAPILLADTSANITAVWLGVMIGVNMQTSFLTPPFGFALFYLRGVAPPDVKTLQMYAGVIPFILLQLGALAIVGAFPTLVNYLPNRVYFTSETAPPPKSPKLQYCVEDYLFKQYDLHGDTLRGQIRKAKSMDLSALPDRRRRSLKESFTAAEATFALAAKVRSAEAAVLAYEPGYRPIHTKVRDLQNRIRRVESNIVSLKTDYRRMSERAGASQSSLADLTRQMNVLKARSKDLAAQIPSNWKQAHKKYVDLTKAEKVARRKYRRNVDEAYEPILELRRLTAQADELAALRPQLVKIEGIVARETPQNAILAIKKLESEFSNIQGVSRIKSRYSRTRRELKRKKPNKQKIAKNLSQGLKRHASEAKWRSRAQTQVGPDLAAYDNALKDTIGLRLQERFNSEQAAEIASCESIHRDISLKF